MKKYEIYRCRELDNDGNELLDKAVFIDEKLVDMLEPIAEENKLSVDRYIAQMVCLRILEEKIEMYNEDRKICNYV